MSSNLEALGITPEKIRAYDQRIPRYTSYPTAPFFTPDFDPDEWEKYIEETSAKADDLSLYVHIPFCRKRCLFCACNVIVTRKEGVADEYLDYLEREIELFAKRYHGAGRAIQLHLGGGTPNFLDHEQMARLLKMLSSRFTFTDENERSIEVDPRIATPEDIDAFYHQHGFRRISFGVQDFNPETQAAIGRGQTRDITFENVARARETGFKSVNIDLIYGLPKQTVQTWTNTVDAIISLRPDRIALYNFAFLPTKLAHQRTLDDADMPTPAEKLDMFIAAHDRLVAAGWEFIGMDHYALKDDSLTRAQREGSLRRNFMGYTTLRGTDLAAFGVSSISDFQNAFAQNVKKLTVYKRMIDEGKLPLERGLALSDDDRARRYMIEEIMCNGVLRFDADTGVEGFNVGEVVREEKDALAPLAEDGLLTIESDALHVTDKGRVFLRNIAVVFDSYLKRARSGKPLFSRAV
ncbi:oxygen-independent coproporphyrinogen III oxidase [bacterium]|nr:oxygen-independent coproporphyrinogen III oxidase [bacterium]